MKKAARYVFFCMVLLLYKGAKAQVCPDHNWDTVNLVFEDNFDVAGRSWYNFFCEPDHKWWAFPLDRMQVTLDNTTFQVYQEGNCHFNNNDGTMELTSSYTSQELHCGDYVIPNYPGCSCNPTLSNLHFFSGHIETDQLYHFGYYEIRCKLPTHPGAFPAFWLFGNGSNSYEEIDIFEYSWGSFYPNNYEAGRLFTTAFWYNPTSTTYDWKRCKSHGHRLESDAPPLSDWHVFGCDWSPNYIRWFLDGKLISSYSVKDTIPQAPKRIKVNYSIDKYAFWEQWTGEDTMSIDYVKVYRLKKDCERAARIQNVSQLINFQYAVKGFIWFSHSAEYSRALEFPQGFAETFRSVNGYRFSGDIRIPLGCTVSFITQDCPSDDE